MVKHTIELNRQPTYQALKADMGVPFWVSDTIKTLDARDPVDALRWLEVLTLAANDKLTRTASVPRGWDKV